MMTNTNLKTKIVYSWAQDQTCCILLIIDFKRISREGPLLQHLRSIYQQSIEAHVLTELFPCLDKKMKQEMR